MQRRPREAREPLEARAAAREARAAAREATAGRGSLRRWRAPCSAISRLNLGGISEGSRPSNIGYALLLSATLGCISAHRSCDPRLLAAVCTGGGRRPRRRRLHGGEPTYLIRLISLVTSRQSRVISQVSHPDDVIKTRMQTHLRGSPHFSAYPSYSRSGSRTPQMLHTRGTAEVQPRYSRGAAEVSR